jgi:hypothetical protein
MASGMGRWSLSPRPAHERLVRSEVEVVMVIAGLMNGYPMMVGNIVPVG